MLPSNSFPSILSMFGIHLTGHCAAKGRQWSGGVINYNQISSYKDPSPLKHNVLWCPAYLINQLPSPQNYQPASFYFTARFILCFLHISSALQRCLWWKRRWMFHHKLLGERKNVFPVCSVQSHRSTFVPFFCCHLLSFVWFGFCACTTAPCNRIKDGADQSYTPEPCILQCQGNGVGSFSIPAWWHFCLRSINQTAIVAQLHERKLAFEANKEEGKDILRKCVEVFHV